MSLRAGLSRSSLQLIGKVYLAERKAEIASLKNARNDIKFGMAEQLLIILILNDSFRINLSATLIEKTILVVVLSLSL
jgi:hypothetical protein